jgi:hypothetical protein
MLPCVSCARPRVFASAVLRRLLWLVLLPIAAAVCSAVVSAQAQTATVTRNVNLRPDSSTEKPSIRLMKPGEVLELLAADEEDGFLHVRTAELQEGWVWSRNVRVGAALGLEAAPAAKKKAATSISEDWDKPEPNKSSFTGPSGKCGFSGVGDEVVSNQRKNRTDEPTSFHEVTFDALSGLPDIVGPKNRSKWTPAQLAEIAKFEGVAVRVVGFLAAVKPQTGSKEGTNCRFSTASETDWHVALTKSAGQGEDDAVVIETTPRIRKKHPKWTKARLAPWTDTNQPVRISGWVFFDTEHRNHLGKFRSTLWEVHPILKIEVLKNGVFVNLDDIP